MGLSAASNAIAASTHHAATTSRSVLVLVLVLGLCSVTVAALTTLAVTSICTVVVAVWFTCCGVNAVGRYYTIGTSHAWGYDLTVWSNSCWVLIVSELCSSYTD